MAIGVSFVPAATPGTGTAGTTPAASPVQQAIQFLSLRLPRVVGANAPSPAALLSGGGAAALGGTGGVDAQLRAMQQRAPQAIPAAGPVNVTGQPLGDISGMVSSLYAGQAGAADRLIQAIQQAQPPRPMAPTMPTMPPSRVPPPQMHYAPPPEGPGPGMVTPLPTTPGAYEMPELNAPTGASPLAPLPLPRPAAPSLAAPFGAPAAGQGFPFDPIAAMRRGVGR